MKTQKNDRQRETEKEMIKNVWKLLLYGGLPALLGFMAMSISLSLAAFIVGLSGVIVVVKKEMPSGRGSIRGTVAVVLGILNIIIFWGLSIFFFLIEVLGWRF